MVDLVEQFQKTHECPKCANSYFTLNVNWLDTYVKTIYTCDSCHWSFIRMSSCTSPANVQSPSLPDRLKVSEPHTQSK
jgi:predicted CxxxxCH...CXXCH cytochrome family protein